MMSNLHWKTGSFSLAHKRTKTVLNRTEMREIEQVLICENSETDR